MHTESQEAGRWPVRVFVIVVLVFLLGCFVAAGPSLAQPAPPDLIFENGFEPLNQPPVADAGDDANATVGVPLVLGGSGSSDPEGKPLVFAWSIESAPAGSAAGLFDAATVAPILIPDRAGDYTLHLVVSDGKLASTPVTMHVSASGTLASSAIIGPLGGGVGLPDGAAVLIPPAALALQRLQTPERNARQLYCRARN